MRRTFVLPAAAVLSAALAACSSVTTPQGVSEAAIDPAIQGQERQLMHSVMTNLPAADRDNVIFIDDNLKIHANKPELLSVLVPIKRISDSTFVAPSGQKLQFAACDVIPERASTPARRRSASSEQLLPPGEGAGELPAIHRGL